MYSEITKEYIKTHKFLNDGVHFDEVKEEANYRLAAGAAIPKSQELKTNELRKKVREIVDLRYEGNYARIQSNCAINRDTLIKFIAGKQKSRGFSRPMLAKLCVGTKLPLELTSELFILQGYALDPVNNLLDAIVVDAIKCGDNINVFFEECEKYGIEMKAGVAY